MNEVVTSPYDSVLDPNHDKLTDRSTTDQSLYRVLSSIKDSLDNSNLNQDKYNELQRLINKIIDEYNNTSKVNSTLLKVLVDKVNTTDELDISSGTTEAINSITQVLMDNDLGTKLASIENIDDYKLSLISSSGLDLSSIESIDSNSLNQLDTKEFNQPLLDKLDELKVVLGYIENNTEDSKSNADKIRDQDAYDLDKSNDEKLDKLLDKFDDNLSHNSIIDDMMKANSGYDLGFNTTKDILDKLSGKNNDTDTSDIDIFSKGESRKGSPSRRSGRLGKLGKLSKGLGVLALGGTLAYGAKEYFDANDDSSRTDAISDTSGTLAGGLAGAKLGAIAGSFIAPGIGTAIGGLVGGGLGALTGSSVGKMIGRYFKDGEDYLPDDMKNLPNDDKLVYIDNKLVPDVVSSIKNDDGRYNDKDLELINEYRNELIRNNGFNSPTKSLIPQSKNSNLETSVVSDNNPKIDHYLDQGLTDPTIIGKATGLSSSLVNSYINNKGKGNTNDIRVSNIKVPDKNPNIVVPEPVVINNSESGTSTNSYNQDVFRLTDDSLRLSNLFK
jgi:hypothetical protein